MLLQKIKVLFTHWPLRSTQRIINDSLRLSDDESSRAAIENLTKALQKNIDDFDINCALGLAFFRSERIDEALTQFRRSLDLCIASRQRGEALTKDSKYPLEYGYIKKNARNQLRARHCLFAAQHLRNIDHKIIENLLTTAIGNDPDNIASWQELLVFLEKKGDEDWALSTAERACKCFPETPIFFTTLGEIASNRLQLPLAVRHYQAALAIDSRHVKALVGLGLALQKLGQKDRAELRFRQALDFSTSDFFTSNTSIIKLLVSLLIETRQLSEAETVLTGLPYIECDPDILLLRARIGVARNGLKQALSFYQEVLTISPDHPMTKEYMGNVHARLGNLESALIIFKQLVNNNPERILARYYYGCHLLKAGQFQKGLFYHESRLDLPRYSEAPYSLQLVFSDVQKQVAHIPKWLQGTSLAGKKLIIWREQGLGDCLMMLRFVRFLKAMSPTSVTLLVDENLKKIAQDMDAANEIISLADWQTLGLEKKESFDLQCSFMSLPWCLDISLEEVGRHMPYLYASNFDQEWLSPIRSSIQLRVGLVWAGNPELAEDAQRSLHLAEMEPLLQIDHVLFVSLQHGTPRMQLATTKNSLVDLMDNCRSFADTAAIVENLDLVISVDTSIVHLAGGLGKPVWMLNRAGSEWRWMQNRQDSPWYPLMRIFNQSTDESWEKTVRMIAEELQSWATKDRAP